MHILNDNQEDNNYTEILNNIYEYDSDDEEISSPQGESDSPLPSRIEHERQVAALKQEQASFFKSICETINAQANFRTTRQILLFVTGPGGTGKSFLLKLIRDRINLVLNASCSQNVLVLAAPT